MTFASRITRQPRAFDPDRGREALEVLPSLPPEIAGLLEGTAGSSPYLAGLIEKEAAWLEGALDAGPEAARDALLGASRAAEDRD